MASSREYLAFVLEQLSALPDVSFRPMMGEYVLYCGGKAVGGVYDDRLLIKPTETALALMAGSSFGVRMDVPYPGAKELLTADADDRELTCRVLQAVADELPAPKQKKRRVPDGAADRGQEP